MLRATSDQVLDSLYARIDRAEDGARLPTVRELMRSFRVSQAAVQEAFDRLRAEGLVDSRVGRGSYVVKASTAAASRRSSLDSLLILSNASMNERCVLVQNRIVSEMAQHGGKVVQMSYHDTDHLLELLASTPRFDAAILQSHYESIPVRLLGLLKAKTRALVVDGHSIAGLDIDRVGTDWEEALDLALGHLAGLGHHRVALISTDVIAQPILGARRAFARLARGRGLAAADARTVLLAGVKHPTVSIDAKLEAALAPLRRNGHLPFTAAVILGVSDGIGLRQCLDRLDVGVPEDLSVYMLGHRDVPSEHFGILTMAGSSHVEAADQLTAVLRRRLADPDLPPQIVHLGTAEALRRSTAAPAAA